MIKYIKTFLNKINLLLSYCMEFSDNRSIIPKINFKDWIIIGLNKRLVIIIIYNKNIFSKHNHWQKMYILNEYYVSWAKKKKRDYKFKLFITIVLTQFFIFIT